MIPQMNAPAYRMAQRIDRAEFQQLHARRAQRVEVLRRGCPRTEGVVDDVDANALGPLHQQQLTQLGAGACVFEDVALDVDVVPRKSHRVEHRAMRLRTIDQDLGVVAGHRRRAQRAPENAGMTALGGAPGPDLAPAAPSRPEVEKPAHPAWPRFGISARAEHGTRVRVPVHRRLPLALPRPRAAGVLRWGPCDRGARSSLPWTAVSRSSAPARLDGRVP